MEDVKIGTCTKCDYFGRRGECGCNAPMEYDEDDSLICPHCHARDEDAWEYLGDGDDQEQELTCHDCGGAFVLICEYTVTYMTRLSAKAKAALRAPAAEQEPVT